MMISTRPSSSSSAAAATTTRRRQKRSRNHDNYEHKILPMLRYSFFKSSNLPFGLDNKR